MKKLLLIAIISLGGYFASGYSAGFSGDKVFKFLNKLDDEARTDSDRACARLDEAMTFTLVDTSTNPATRQSGGKKELCRYLSIQEILHRTAAIADRHYFTALNIQRDWRHWNKATIHYEDHHDLEVFPARNVIRFMSSEDMALVKDGDSFRITRWDISISLK
jgi:hypothetical protein